jgi:hypothetical protein
VYPVLPVSLDFPFLIAPSVFSNVYFYRAAASDKVHQLLAHGRRFSPGTERGVKHQKSINQWEIL